MSARYTIILRGEQLDEHGLPDPFARYEILVSGWGKNSTVLTIAPVSQSAKQLARPHHIVESGGAGRAYEVARDLLRQEHPGLEVVDDPERPKPPGRR